MISVVIPLYNKAQSIANTIQCIQNQTYQDFEIVVVDGWSKDGSTEIIKKLAEEDSRITVLMQQNRKGVTPARNESVDAAKSDRIAFLDADDYWDPNYLENLVALMDQYPEAGIWGMNYGVIENGTKKEHVSIIPSDKEGIIEKPFQYGCPYWTGAVGISKKAFEKVGGFDNRIIYGEDIDLWYRLMLNFPAAYSHKVFAYYRLDAENRACNHVFPLRIHLPFYIDKYKEYREHNADFCRFFDLQCLYRLFPYVGIPEYKEDLKTILSQIDFSKQKKSMKLRFQYPRLYKLYQKLRGRGEEIITESYQGGSILK